jgi:hypothetical protein
MQKQTMRFLKHSLVWLSLSSSIAACGVQLPAFPDVWQCAWAGTPRAFFCVNTKTGERRKIDASDAVMNGAQCLSSADYVRSEEWIDSIKEIARARCK